jgi:glucose-1-phosphate thymidylyltransferase
MKLIKGIILAGGYGSRLYPLTFGTSKQLLPVYDRPMIYYPLSTLMNAGIKDILIISTNKDLPRFRDLLMDGRHIGLNITYKVQDEPRGIAESFIIASDFIGDCNVCLILGDNIFHGKNFNILLDRAKKNLDNNYSTIFGVEVNNPNEFGVIEFDSNNEIKNIVEKPDEIESNLIVSGLYFYTNDVVTITNKLKPSSRGELEITDINNQYLALNKLKLVNLDSEISWIDTGTYDSLIEASRYFQNFENKTAEKVACIEEIALNLGYIDKSQFVKIANSMNNSNYGKYLLKRTGN